MIRLVENQLRGLAAIPKDYPVTCANPAPWYITEMKIQSCHSFNDDPMKYGIYIRGNESMWFRLEHCMVGEYDELKDWLDYQTEQEHINKSVRTFIKLV